MEIIIEKHPDGYIAYPLGMKGVVIGQGDTYAEALEDVRSAIHFHLETFGKDSFEKSDNIDLNLSGLFYGPLTQTTERQEPCPPSKPLPKLSEFLLTPGFFQI